MVSSIVVDFAIGCLCLYLTIQFTTYWVSFFNFAGHFLHLEYLQQKIYWLLGQPAGFKPNLSLAHFFGNVVLEFVSVWEHITSALTLIRTYIIIYLSFVGVFGTSCTLAAGNDAVFFFSFMLLIMYSSFALMYSRSLKMLRMLYKLFRGRKYNIIRARDDSSNFGINELYLGVLIITLIIFLLPTIAIYYYYAFISIILMVMFLQVFCIAGQVLITEFPYFLLCWSLVHPYILPNSIRMELHPQHHTVKILTVGSGIGSIFSNLAS